jgi:iron-sulfur cluster repair protein YtfE (RIC family)
MPTPIKRHKALQPLSREHHQGLLLCWKIRTGFSKGIDAQRIKAYSDWFYANHLLPHFKEEESYLFPLLGNDHELVVKAIGEHYRLKELFEEKISFKEALHHIEKELEQHIRFEERVLFNEIQSYATEEDLKGYEIQFPETPYSYDWGDPFWI